MKSEKKSVAQESPSLLDKNLYYGHPDKKGTALGAVWFATKALQL